jgi:hypothetical protein
MLMVRIGEMRVRVSQGRMSVEMAMTDIGGDWIRVIMLMVQIVNMLMRVLEFGMDVIMMVLFRKMEPDAYCHQGASKNERRRQWLAHRQCKHCTNKRSN